MTNANAIKLFEALDAVDTLGDAATAYQAYLTAEGLPQMSADELLHEDITAEQSHAVGQFLRFWNNAIEGEETEAGFVRADGTVEETTVRRRPMQSEK